MERYTPERSSPVHHSYVAIIVSIMRRHSLLLACLAAALGFVLALPNNSPMIVQREIERVMNGVRSIDVEVTAPVSCARCSHNPEEDMTTIEIIRKSGYPAEEHFVTTQDGYILALHRILGSEGSPVVLLHHALLESSFCWVISGKEKGLAYILADEGYDVWMGNVRGNTYSKNHTKFSTSDPAFWNFTWHEMGIYDVPAEIEYITKFTNDKITYVGHSMGTTMFYVMASERPDIASKVKAMFGLAPVAFIEHIRGPFWLIGTLVRNIQKFSHFDGQTEFFASSSAFKFAAKCICNRPILKEICQGFIFSTVGFNSEQFNTSMLPLILTHTPAGTSLKTLLHFAQGIQSGRFLHYDYGAETNKRMYNSETPPEYNFSKIQVPIALFWGQNDFLAQPKDVRRLYKELPKKVDMYRIDDPNFNHLDFLWGIDAPQLVYSRLLHLMEKYRYSNATFT